MYSRDYKELSWLNLSKAAYSKSDLMGRDFSNCNLQGANLQGANLQGANLQGANLQGAYMQLANLQGANLQWTNMDFACIQLSCRTTRFKVDDRIFSQILYQLTRLDTTGCSGGVQEAVEAIKNMAVSDLFCEYRNDVKPLQDNN